MTLPRMPPTTKAANKATAIAWGVMAAGRRAPGGEVF
jgi:hypothetical protein